MPFTMPTAAAMAIVSANTDSGRRASGWAKKSSSMRWLSMPVPNTPIATRIVSSNTPNCASEYGPPANSVIDVTTRVVTRKLGAHGVPVCWLW